MSYGTVGRILRDVLKWKAYMPHSEQAVSPANKESRLAASTFWLVFEDEWLERVIRMNKKWFTLKQSPNEQDERFRASGKPSPIS